jgi:hypothetical protein
MPNKASGTAISVAFSLDPDEKGAAEAAPS